MLQPSSSVSCLELYYGEMVSVYECSAMVRACKTKIVPCSQKNGYLFGKPVGLLTVLVSRRSCICRYCLSRDEIFEYVKRLYGFGEFAARNVTMLLGFYDLVPMDSETVGIKFFFCFSDHFSVCLSRFTLRTSTRSTFRSRVARLHLSCNS